MPSLRTTIQLLTMLMAAIMATSCIHNDIPYPRIQANILTFDVKGQDGAPIIDTVARTVTVPFPEDADLYNVTVTGYSLTPGSHFVEDPFNTTIDLSTPLPVYIRLYQDWLWTIVARQDIERYFEVEGQMGESTIDVPGHRVVVSVRSSADPAAITIKRIKLGPTGSTMQPELTAGSTFNGTGPFEIEITNYGHTETWSIYVLRMAEAVRTVSAEGWSRVAWVTGQAEAGLDNGVEYRLTGSEEWTRVPQEDISSNSGTFTACIKHLSPNSSYQARAYSENDFGDILDFTTGSEPQIPNADFEYWWLDKKVWCPWQEGHDAFWGTGNPGAATLGQSNVYPTEDTPSGSGYAACLETRFVGIGSLGKLAAGSVFAGYFVRTDGTNGILSMGREFSQRPTGIRGKFKYTGATINYADKAAEFQAMLGQPDTCIVWMALVDSSTPIEIRTNPSNRALFDPDADYCIAYGKMEQSQTVTSYIPFELHLDYKSTSRVPRYLLITASSSKYGDYFTGGTGAVMYVDDLVLEYDY